jgi:hypothetical protein
MISESLEVIPLLSFICGQLLMKLVLFFEHNGQHCLILFKKEEEN